MHTNQKILGYKIISVGIIFIFINITLMKISFGGLSPFYLLSLFFFSDIFYILGFSSSATVLPIIFMYSPVILLGLYYILKQKNVKDGVTETNLYFEYRQWNLFWGFFFDGKTEIQNILNYYNSKGWKVIDFEWGGYSHFGLFRTIAIFYVTIVTLGVLSYWVGFFAIFEGVKTQSSQPSQSSFNFEQKENIEKTILLENMSIINPKTDTYKEWKEQNPNKSINDYYNEQNKKT